MKRLLLPFFACMAAVSLLAAQALAEETVLPDDFAGTWRIHAEPDAAAAAAGQKPFKEALLFGAGRLSGEALGMYGFTPGDYLLTGEVGAVSFVATMTSDNRGKILFVGKVSGGKLLGKLEWTKPDGQVHTYDFDGEPFNPEEL